MVRIAVRLTSPFRDTRLSKIGNAPNDPKLNLNIIQLKVPCIHQRLTPEAQSLDRAVLRLAVSELQGQNAPNDPKLYLNTYYIRVKSILITYTKYPRVQMLVLFALRLAISINIYKVTKN